MNFHNHDSERAASPDLDVEPPRTPPTSIYQSRLFLTSVGTMSLIVFLYAAFLHSTLLFLAVVYRAQFHLYLPQVLSWPPIFGLHVSACQLGPVLAISFIYHVYRN